MKFPFQGLFKGPLANWQNDDLLITAERRQYLAKHMPWAVSTFHWPELCELFMQFEISSKRDKLKVRRQGLAAVLLSTMALVIAAFMPLIPANSINAIRTLGILASLFAVVGGWLGLSHLLRGKTKGRWLAARMQAERLRHLYFQTLLANAESLTSSSGIEEADWRSKRAQALTKFSQSISKDPVATLKRLEQDRLDEEAAVLDEARWLFEGNAQLSLRDADPLKRQEFLKFFDVQRVGIQLKYVSAKLQPGPHSPSFSSAAISLASKSLTVLVLIVAAIIGVEFAMSNTPNADIITYALVFEAAGCALLAGVKVLDDGLAFSDEEDLFSWYAAAVGRSKNAFDAAPNEQKFGVLVGLEQASYEEFRRFFTAHDNTSFLI